MVLCCAAVAAPLTFVYRYSHTRSLKNEQQRLAGYARWMTRRADAMLSDATSAAQELEKGGWQDCSDQHIQAMRLAVMRHRSIQEIGYFPDGFLRCTSWGPVQGNIPHIVTYRTSAGIDVSARVNPLIRSVHPIISFSVGHHNALVLPENLIDTQFEGNIGLTLANHNGLLLASSNTESQALVDYAIAHPGSGLWGDYLYASYQSTDWTAITVEHRSSVLGGYAQAATLLPFGLLIAGSLVTVILWLLRRRLSPRAELETAIRNREFIAFYQPIVELATGRCLGAEALIRWRRPDGNLISPALFIPFAEETGLLAPITDQLMERVLEETQNLLRNNPDMHISINLSAADMESGRPLPLLTRLLQEKGLYAHQIWLEATERGFINPEAARNTLMAARSRGHAIAVDDFGTGYSSLGLLHSLPIDALKIDKSFIDAIGTASVSSTVTQHIITMAAALQLDVIAEGIETEQQAAYLRERNVRYGQGWLFAKAMPLEEFLLYTATHCNPALHTA